MAVQNLMQEGTHVTRENRTKLRKVEINLRCEVGSALSLSGIGFARTSDLAHAFFIHGTAMTREMREQTSPVQEMLSTPGPKYSTIAPVPPLTVRMPATLQMMSFGEPHLESLPVSRTPMTLGAFSSQGRPAMTSTASAPPTPTAQAPKPPAFGVCESVPIMRQPGKA